MRRLLFIFSFDILCSLFFAFPVCAANTSLTVSPAIIESIVKPGKTVKTTITISNDTNFPVPIKSSVKNFTETGVVIEEDQSAFDASSWFKLDPPDFILQPHEQKDVNVSILAPLHTEPGGHYATLYFEPLLPQEALSNSSTQSLARVGVLAFLIAPGDIQEHITLKNFVMDRFQNFGPLTFSFQLDNTGNLHLLPSGKFIVTDILHHQVETLTLDPAIVLPHTSRAFNLTWDKQLLFGRYTISGVILYGSDHINISVANRSIWIIPIPLVLLALILLTSIVWFVIVGRKRFSMAWRVLTGQAESWEIKKITFKQGKLKNTGDQDK